MTKGLKIAEPPRRRTEPASEPTPLKPAVTGEKFSQVRADDMVQFNKRVKRSVADGYQILSVKTRKRVPELIEEALALLEEKYGKV